MLVMSFAQTKTQINEYVVGKKWYYYLPLWLFGIYIFVELLGFDPNKQLPFVIGIAQSFDFFLHEMAHIVTAFLPAIICAASGSLSEILLGTMLIVTAFKTKGYFSVMICCLWFMLACQSAGTYMADAVVQKLSLVSLGSLLAGGDGSGRHDWHFVFGQLHILGASVFIGDAVRAIGIIVGAAGIVFAAWLLYRMADAKPVSVPVSADNRPVRLKSIGGFTSYPIGMEPKKTSNAKEQNSKSSEQ